MTTPETLDDEDEGEPSSSWFGPGVGGIGTASLLADVGHEIPTALLPSLLTGTLGASASVLGVIEGVSDGLAGAARLAGGAIADDPHRRRAVAVGGYTTTAVLSAATGGATAAWQVAVLRAGAWTARGLRVPARNALLADIVPASSYGRAYGFERMMDNLGAIIGPVLAIVLVGAVGVRTAIALSVIPGLLAAVAIVYAIRHTRAPRKTEREPIRLKIRPVLDGPLGHLMAGIAVFEVGNCAATLLILRATDLLSPGRSADSATQLAIGLYVAYNAAATITSLPGHHSDRRGAPRTLLYGVLMFAVAYTLFAVGPASVIALAPAFIGAGIGIGAIETAEHAAVAALAPKPSAARRSGCSPRCSPSATSPRAPSPGSSTPPSHQPGPSGTSPSSWPSPSRSSQRPASAPRDPQAPPDRRTPATATRYTADYRLSSIIDED